MLTSVRRFLKSPLREKMLFVSVLMQMYLIKVLLLFISFKKASKIFRQKGTQEPKESLIPLKVAINRATKLTFWKNKCLVNTLVARAWLNKKGYRSDAYLGLKKENDETKAHAWIESGNLQIIDSEADYSILYKF